MTTDDNTPIPPATDPSAAASCQRTWFDRHPKRTLLAFYAILLLFAEGTLRILAYQGYVPIKHYVGADVVFRFLGDINPDFGVWHFPHRTVRHTAPCFDVTYSSNSYGARDAERTLESSAARRAVVLGDSFVEGLGVNSKDRATDVAERLTGVEFLNFGVSGNFSSTQQWLLYRGLASKFQHSEVFLFMLPDNDFAENDPQTFSAKRYRPYLRKTNQDSGPGEFEVYYPVKFEDREAPREVSLRRQFRYKLYNASYLLNVFRQIGERIEDSELKDVLDDEAMKEGQTASYNKFNELDLERLLWGYRKIIDLAQNRPVTFFIIPRDVDFLKYFKDGYHFKIVEEMERFTKGYPNVRVVDLLPIFLAYAEKHKMNYEDFFISCDGHWSPLGNEIVAQALMEAVAGPPIGGQIVQSKPISQS